MLFFRGAGAFLYGIRFVFGTRRVWWRAALPALVALALSAVLVAAGVHFALPWAHHLFGEGLGEKVFAVLLVGVVGITAVVIALALARPLSGWALDGIVQEQRRAMGTGSLPPLVGSLGRVTVVRTPPSALASAGQSMVANLMGLGVGVPMMMALALLGWVFPPATIATAPLDVVIAALLLAWDLLDYPLSVHGLSPGDRARWCRGHFWVVLGFGLAASAFFAIPIVGWLALPFGVAGATRLVVSER
jgi:CysZ protein